MNREQRQRLNLGTWIPPRGPVQVHVRRRTGYSYAAITLYVVGLTGIAYGRVFRCRALRAR
jgi:hypothetical protein